MTDRESHRAAVEAGYADLKGYIERWGNEMTEDGDHKPNDTYLGDGVYASFDGYQIWLAVNDHRNKVVALDPNVVVRLIKYAMENDMLEMELERVG